MTSPAGLHSARASPDALGLSPDQLSELIERALQEDIGAGDLTTRLTVPEKTGARGTFRSQQTMTVAGLPVTAEVFRRLEPGVRWESLVEDGREVVSGVSLAVAEGSAAALLAGERVALNFLQRLSGIATLTRRLKGELRGLKAELLDTRKTTPGLRALEKYAVRVGGGRNHRIGLDDGILIKNNHLRLAGGVRAAIERARRNRAAAGRSLPIEVEVRRLEDLEDAIAAGAEAVLLDNMAPRDVRRAVERARGRVRLEVSGGIHAANIRAYGETGVDFISVGALTHSAPAAHIHFLIEPRAQ